MPLDIQGDALAGQEEVSKADASPSHAEYSDAMWRPLSAEQVAMNAFADLVGAPPGTTAATETTKE